MFAAEESIFFTEEQFLKFYKCQIQFNLICCRRKKKKTQNKTQELSIGKNNCEKKQGKEMHGDRLLIHI